MARDRVVVDRAGRHNAGFCRIAIARRQDREEAPYMRSSCRRGTRQRISPAACNSLIAQDYPATRLSVLVVNDHSVDDTAAIVDDFAAARSANRSPARVRRCRRAGPASRMPVGSARARSCPTANGCASSMPMSGATAICCRARWRRRLRKTSTSCRLRRAMNWEASPSV